MHTPSSSPTSSAKPDSALLLFHDEESARRVLRVVLLIVALVLALVLPGTRLLISRDVQQVQALMPVYLGNGLLYLLAYLFTYRLPPFYVTLLIIPLSVLPILSVAAALPQLAIELLYFISAISLFAALVLHWRLALLVSLVHFLMLLATPLLLPTLDAAAVYIGPLRFHIVLAGLAVFAAYYRQQVLDTYQQQLSDREALLSAVNAGRLDPFWLLEAARDDHAQLIGFRVLDVNQRAADLLQSQPETLRGLWLQRDVLLPLTAASLLEPVMQRVTQALTMGQPYEEEFALPMGDGTTRWFYQQVVPIGDRLALSLRDITERRSMEETLRLSEARYRVVSQMVSDYAYSFVIGDDGTPRVEWITEEGFLRATGYDPSVVSTVSKANTNIAYPGEEGHATADFMRVIETGQPYIGEYRMLTANGEVRHSRIWRTPEIDPDTGRVVRVVGVVSDITERKMAEEALRRSEERYRIVSEMMSDYAYSFIIDDDGEFHLEWITEESHRRVTGLEPEDVERNIRIMAQGAKDNPALDNDFQAVLRGESVTNTYHLQMPNGKWHWLEISRRPVLDPESGRVVKVIGMACDITERTEAQEALRASEARYRAITEMISDYAYSFSVDAEGVPHLEWITEESFKRLTGYAAHEILTNLKSANQAVTHPDDLDRINADFANVMASGQPHIGEYRIITASGETRWTRVWRRPEVDPASGRVVRIMGVVTDITERREAEAHALALAREREQVAALQRFMGDMSHDLMTPLSIITTGLYLLVRTDDAAARHERAERMEEQIKQLRDMFDDMLEMARLDRPTEESFRFEPLNLVDFVRDTVEYFGTTADKAGITLRAEVVAERLMHKMDPVKLRRALGNVIDNALKYTPAGTTVTVSCTLDAEAAIIRVDDDGPGIPADALPKLFDRFYRVGDHRPGTGTGLGLAITRKIIEAHGGTVTASSTLGDGTCFTIRLPRPQS